MPAVELDIRNIKWPNSCCRCGSDKFTHRTHTDKVVVRTVLSVTQYQKISLRNVPICDRCTNAKILWFVAAAVCGVIGYLIAAQAKGAANDASSLILLLFIAGIVFAIVGVNKAPIKILRFDEKKNSITVKVYNPAIAKQMMEGEAVRSGTTQRSGNSTSNSSQIWKGIVIFVAVVFLLAMVRIVVTLVGAHQ